MSFTRNDGSDNDSFIDDNSLIVHDTPAVPEPASMFALGVGAVGLLRRKRK